MAADPAEHLVAIYQDAYREILERLATKEARGNVTSYERALLADVTRILTELDGNTRDWIERELPLIYQGGQAEALRQLAAAGANVEGIKTSLAGINQQAVNILAANLYGDLSDANRLVGRQVNDLFRQAGIQAITTKVSTGQTVKEAQRNLRQQLAAEGITGFTDSRGRQWRLDSYAEMVARTTTREATNRGTLTQLSELGYDLVKITEHYPTCDICAPFQGRVYSISGKDERFPKLFGTAFGVAYATVHPNCSHSIVPYIEALQDDVPDDIKRSNAPFDVDPRTERERQAYLAGQAKKRAARADREQFERYRATLPNHTPATFSGFRRMKQANSERYQELQRLYREVGKQAVGGRAPVSAALTVPTGDLSDTLTRTLASIDRVHQDGVLPPIDIQIMPDLDADGAFARTREHKAVAIFINPNAPNPGMTLAHEVGHFLDFFGITGSGGPSASDLAAMSDRAREAYVTLARAIDGSKSYQHLERIAERGTINVTWPDGKRGPYRLEPMDIAYYLSTEECFARAYAQYIATQSSDSALKAELRQIRRRRRGIINWPRQWSDRDFVPIRDAMTGLFRELGWIDGQDVDAG